MGHGPGTAGRGNGRGPAAGGGPPVAVVGCGHVGAVTAAGLAALGCRVAGVDTDAGRVRSLAAGRSPFLEPGLGDLLRAGLREGRLAFTTSHREATAGAEFLFLCVDTPPPAGADVDGLGVEAAARQVLALPPAPGGREPPLLVIKSTAPVGTAEAMAGLPGRPRVVVNPEFLREGTAVRDFFHPDRVVVGAERREDAMRVAALYAPLGAPVLATDLRTAELIKHVANAFLATRLSFVNEVARLCERLGVEVDAVAAGAGMDPRIGRAFFTPGIGYGGSCLPKDVAALARTAAAAGTAMPVLAAVQAANQAQRQHAVDALRFHLGTLAGRVVAAWGLAFKGGTDDLRNSPALEVVELLRRRGALIRAYDPAVPSGRLELPGAVLCGSALAAARGADAVAILTDWPEFGAADWAAVRAAMAGDLVYDGRNAADRAAVEAAGLRYHGVGRPPAPLRAGGGPAGDGALPAPPPGGRA